jgi:hypothetical protein
MIVSEIFKSVQKLTSNPLLFIGSGASAAYGLPNMYVLGEYLISTLSPKYSDDTEWKRFEENLANGQDLETALTDIILKSAIINDIRKVTWELVSDADLKLFNDITFGVSYMPLAALIKKLFQVHPQTVNIITTNYDRVIEYACDKAGIPVNTGFNGCYSKRYVGAFNKKNTVNLIKVHGSLDLFKDSKNATISLPLQHQIPDGLLPEIITPGISKYQAVLTGIERPLLTEGDIMINNAESYLCIGYGFNDTQIQAEMINNIKKGKPLVLVTKKVSESTAHLLANNATNYIYINEGETEGTTEFCINKKLISIDGTYWTVDGFMNIID